MDVGRRITGRFQLRTDGANFYRAAAHDAHTAGERQAHDAGDGRGTGARPWTLADIVRLIEEREDAAREVVLRRKDRRQA